MSRVHGRDAAGWLALAAAPIFAAMALASSVWGGGPFDRLCAPIPGFPMGGMSQLYWLLCVFHLSPWLRLAASGGDPKIAGDEDHAG